MDKNIDYQELDRIKKSLFEENSLMQKALYADSWIHELGRVENENGFAYLRQSSLETIAEKSFGADREDIAKNLLQHCFELILDCRGQSNPNLKGDLIYAMRVAAEIIGPEGTPEIYKNFGLRQIQDLVGRYNFTVENAYNRGDTISCLSVESFDSKTKQVNPKRIVVDKDNKLAA
jgi:hypothetical protein